MESEKKVPKTHGLHRWEELQVIGPFLWKNGLGICESFLMVNAILRETETHASYLYVYISVYIFILCILWT